jgi:CDP-glucose 4,6-dehydratase
MKRELVSPSFWNGKKVFLTGHTGFKGSWLLFWLSSMGAKVTGYSLAPDSKAILFDAFKGSDLVDENYFADILDLENLQYAISRTQPEIVIHMAAQSLVRTSYANPVMTYATNVMGTVNMLEAVRANSCIQATLIVTTDKCYENKEWCYGYRENDPLGGLDPYSSSKACAELVTAAYRHSFLQSSSTNQFLASARAGNVIGGGDRSMDRLVPDIINTLSGNQPLVIRNPQATRPWQHVLEPLCGYLILLQKLWTKDSQFASSWNFGPQNEDHRSVQELAELFVNSWGGGEKSIEYLSSGPHEAQLLKLDCSKSQSMLQWQPLWKLETAVQKVIEWEKAYHRGMNMSEITLQQISEYMGTQ